MALKGRRPLTEEAVRQRIADYCARYGVHDMSPAGFPAYPAGQRETPQHRAWIVLYKAFGRLQRRQLDEHAKDATSLPSDGRCPICLEALSSPGPDARPSAEAASVSVHARCREVVGFVARLGPAVLERLRHYAWPSPTASDGKVQRRRRRA